jgi:D-2-hydroxyacid dehydrogenase (NADP+)
MTTADRVLVVQAHLPEDALARVAAAAGSLRVVTRSELQEQPALFEQAEVLFTQQTDALRIAKSSTLRWVQTYGAGVEWLLVPEVTARNDLIISNASGIHAQPIAEHVFGWLLTFARNLHKADRQARLARWDSAPLREGLSTLEGKTLGVLGLGAIGLRIAELGTAFRMNVVGHRRRQAALPAPVQAVYSDLHQFLGASDFVINTLPLTQETMHLLGAREFDAMRPHAILVNIGRGPTVDTVALVDALSKAKIGGAALDVTDPEPLPQTHSLWKFENVLLTPHYAGAHPAYNEGVTTIFVNNLSRYLAGEPLTNVVDPARGY